MKVILLQDVAKVGRKFDVKDVASGYAANFLIPRKQAELATSLKLKHLKTLKAKQVEEDTLHAAVLAKNLKSLKDVSIKISAKANKLGHLFQGIHAEEIATQLRKQERIEIPKECIALEHPIKAIGNFEIPVRIGDEATTFKLSVVEE